MEWRRETNLWAQNMPGEVAHSTFLSFIDTEEDEPHESPEYARYSIRYALSVSSFPNQYEQKLRYSVEMQVFCGPVPLKCTQWLVWVHCVQVWVSVLLQQMLNANRILANLIEEKTVMDTTTPTTEPTT